MKYLKREPNCGVEMISQNSEGKLVLPQDWYDTEDDIYDVKYGEYFE